MRYEVHELAHRRWAVIDNEKNQILLICSVKNIAIKAWKRLLEGYTW